MKAINEFSRTSQLVNNGAAILATALAKYSVTMDALIAEIADTVVVVDANAKIESAGWYSVANGFAMELAGTYGTTVEIAAAVLSAVSPRMPWLRNKKVARAILANYKAYDHLSASEAASELGMALGANVTMAVKIARGESIADTLTGTKRRSFYNNIIDPTGNDSVTVDTWMIRAAMRVTGMDLATGNKFLDANKTALGGTGAGYYAIAEATRTVAKSFGMTANAVQATYWIAVSGSFNGARTDIS